MAIKRARNPSSTTSQQPSKKPKTSPPYLPDDILLPMSTTSTFVTFNDDKGLVFLDDKLRCNGINLEVGENTSIRGLLASTNGLLCLYCSELNEKFLHICNQRRECIESDQMVHMEHTTLPWRAKKLVLANRVLYWDCTHYMLYFDYDNMQSGYISMPEELPRFAGHEVKVCEGRVTYTRLYENLEVWTLNKSHGGCDDKWEKL